MQKFGKAGFPVIAIVVCAAISGCATTSLEDAAPQAALPAPKTVAQGEQATATAVAPGANQTGAFPNLNVVPKGETAQLSKADQAQSVAELNAIRTKNQATGAGKTVSSVAEMRRIARSHASDALETIENE